MTTAMQNQKAAVNTAHWLLYRYNPERLRLGENPLQLDSAAPRVKLADYFSSNSGFKILEKGERRVARELLAQAQVDVNERRTLYTNFSLREKSTPYPTHEPNDQISRL